MRYYIFLLLALIAVVSCKTNTVYKTVGVIVITAEVASDSWLDYYVMMKYKSPSDELERKNEAVKDAWIKYQKTMDAFDIVYRGYVLGVEDKDRVLEVLEAVKKSSDKLIDMVISFLPKEERNKLYERTTNSGIRNY